MFDFFIFYRNITYHAPKEWAVHVPVSAIILFFAVPIIYSGMNSLTVAPLTSLDNITDDYTRKQTASKIINTK